MKGIIKSAALVVGTALVTTVATGRAYDPNPTVVPLTPQTWTIQCQGGSINGNYETGAYSNDIRISLVGDPRDWRGGFNAATLTGCTITTP